MRTAAAVVIILIICVTSLYTQRSEAKEVNNDTHRLLEISRPLLKSDYQVVFKWSMEASGYAILADFLALSRKLNLAINLPAKQSLEQVNGLPLLRASAQQPDGTLLQSLLVGSTNQQTSTWIVKLAAAQPLTAEQIEQAQNKLEGKITMLGHEGSWNIAVQGMMSEGEQVIQPHSLLDSINEQFAGVVQERYEDDRTCSISIQTKQIHAVVQSGDHMINVQVALHQNSISNEWRFTIGTPVITLEY